MYSPGLGADKPVSLSFQKLSGPTAYPNFQVGDTWSVTVTGPANQPVYVAGNKDGVVFPTYQIGTTDESGTFVLNGTMAAADVGSWFEVWTVGGTLSGNINMQGRMVGSVNFTLAAPAPAQPQQQTTPTTPPSPATSPAFVNTVLNSGGLQIAGYDIPWWAVGVAGAGLLFMFTGRRR
jgi:hypothetical protein